MAKRGRPSNLTPELKKKGWEYVKKIEEQEKKIPEIIPSIAGLAFELGIPRQKVWEYAEKDEEFRDIVEGVMKAQERRILNLASTGKINPAIAKLLLMKHGYTEKSEVEMEIKEKLIELDE
ncbi:MAG: hypothetical protein KatS3mg096_757 [Candidatus Parcubacteria bacterium]|nr:MAG: hypothetical protein KatS3mg096_757 [Candidatus Parcubacteria bacterium]